jgi:hypothetical protein
MSTMTRRVTRVEVDDSKPTLSHDEFHGFTDKLLSKTRGCDGSINSHPHHSNNSNNNDDDDDGRLNGG